MNPLLQKIANAKASLGGNIIRDGIYLFTVRKIILDNMTSGNMFIAEFTVDEAQPMADMYEKGGRPCWADDPGAKLVAPNAVGSTCSMALNLDTNKSATGNAKAFVLGLLGEEEENVSAEDFLTTLQELIHKTQPGRGMRVRMQTFRKKIKQGDNAGKPCVCLKWEHVEQTAEQIAKRRGELDRTEKEAA